MTYSVIIRTLTGGDKYLALLSSIDHQSVKPEHIFIVQPHGFTPPKETIGYEEYIQCKKGMWMQRIYGMEYCYSLPEHSKYLLVCDDDVTFEPDFVEKLIILSEENNADTMIPLPDLRLSLGRRLLYTFLQGPLLTKKDKYRNRVLLNGCWACNNSLTHNVNPTQSGNFQCFLMRTDITPQLNLRDELWIDETRYAWPDDMMFFYKAHLNGLNILSCKQPTYIHHDGKAGVSNIDRIKDAAYSQGRNGLIFWSRFIKNRQVNKRNKLKAKIYFNYRVLATRLIYIILGIKRKSFFQLSAYNRGLRDAKKHPILSSSSCL